jgi:hypothetical protein
MITLYADVVPAVSKTLIEREREREREFSFVLIGAR